MEEKYARFPGSRELSAAAAATTTLKASRFGADMV